jgi:hypothetical protein
MIGKFTSLLLFEGKKHDMANTVTVEDAAAVNSF